MFGFRFVAFLWGLQWEHVCSCFLAVCFGCASCSSLLMMTWVCSLICFVFVWLVAAEGKHDESSPTKNNSHTHTKQDPKGRMPKQNPRIAEHNHCYVFALAACSLLERAGEGTAVGLSHHQQRKTGNTPRANCQEAGTYTTLW